MPISCSSNPLDDIANTSEIEGVVGAGGRWMPRTELQSMLGELAAKYEDGRW